MRPTQTAVCAAAFVFLVPPCPAETIASVEQLTSALQNGRQGDVLLLAPGVFRLSEPIELKSGMTLRGSGINQTVISHVADWNPSTETLPDPHVKTRGMDTRAFLIRIKEKAAGVTVSHLSLEGPKMHGAIFGFGNEDLHVHDLRVKNFLWCGVRTFSMRRSKIHDCEFIDAGGRWRRGGIPGVDGGTTGGGIFAVWMKDCEIAHNRFTRTQLGKQDHFYGIKCRQVKRSRIHHNTINVNFSIEMPFENDEDVEIDHNVCDGTISIPKHAGGPLPASGRTFHIHHNYFRSSYSIEFARNGVEIDHNLFDFSLEQDGGNLISGFGKAAAGGPALLHNNLISNPGRGVIWIRGPFSNLEFRNNHIVARTTATPRSEGLFGFNQECDFTTIRVANNIIECVGVARPLARNDASYSAQFENNLLTNVLDAERLENRIVGVVSGLEDSLKFACGVHGELNVDGWETRSAE